MNQNKILRDVLILITVGNAISALGQTTIYEQSRSGNNSSGANNPDFATTGTWTSVGSKSTAPGLPAGSTSSRYTATPSTSATHFTVSPNHTTAGQLVNGTTYAVAITFPSVASPNNESADIAVTTTDTGNINDTFAGTSTCFQKANGVNMWIPVGDVTVNSASPTFTFTWSSGTASARWYMDSIKFTPQATPQYWDTGSLGGSGTWDLTTPNWNSKSDGTGTQGAQTQADLAIFRGTAGTITIGSSGITTDGGLEFDVNGYTISGGTLTLGSGPTQGTNITVVYSGNTATISSVIVANHGVSLTGLGTLGLGVNQNFSSLSGTGPLALGANALTVGGDNTSTTFTGVISDANGVGDNALTKVGSGTLNLGGAVASTFAGTTVINAGTLSIPTLTTPDSALGQAPGSPVANQLTMNGIGQIAAFWPVGGIIFSPNRGITLNGTSNLITSFDEIRFNNSITGNGGLIIPSGIITFNAPNDFAGDIVFALTNFVVARFNVNNSSGQGTIRIVPQVAAQLPYGPTYMTLRQNTSGVSTTVANPIVFDESFLIAQSYNIDTAAGGANFTLSGNMSGPATGGVNINDNSNGRGTVVLSGSNSAFSGGFNLQGGVLSLGSSNALGTGTFSVTATTSYTPSTTYYLQAALPLTGASAVRTPIKLTVPSGFIIQGANALELSGPITLAPSSGTSIDIEINNSAATIFSGSVNDQGLGLSLTLNQLGGTGTLTLSGSNNWTGGTTVSSGTLEGSVSNSIPGTSVMVNGGATLQLDVPNAMSPGATLTVSAGGVLNLNFTGYQTVSSLIVNGSPVASPGTYGANVNNPGGITGTGFINVTPLPTPFSITSESIDNSGNFVVCWTSVVGQTYDVMTNTSLGGNGSWVSAGSVNATTSPTCFTLPGGTAGNHSVYVQIQAP